jgi:hypothetical protein
MFTPKARVRLDRATRAFLDTVAEAQMRVAAGDGGPEVPKLLAHAQSLLDIIDEEMLNLDSVKSSELFASAAKMRVTLAKLNASVTRSSDDNGLGS